MGFRCRCCGQFYGDNHYQGHIAVCWEFDDVCYDCLPPPLHVTSRRDLAKRLANLSNKPRLTPLALAEFLAAKNSQTATAGHFGVSEKWIRVLRKKWGV